MKSDQILHENFYLLSSYHKISDTQLELLKEYTCFFFYKDRKVDSCLCTLKKKQKGLKTRWIDRIILTLNFIFKDYLSI